VTLIDTEAVAIMLGITPNAVRILATRYSDRLPRHGRDARGRILHALEDVDRIVDGRTTSREKMSV
jgi:hypothetical protein